MNKDAIIELLKPMVYHDSIIHRILQIYNEYRYYIPDERVLKIFISDSLQSDEQEVNLWFITDNLALEAKNFKGPILDIDFIKYVNNMSYVDIKSVPDFYYVQCNLPHGLSFQFKASNAVNKEVLKEITSRFFVCNLISNSN